MKKYDEYFEKERILYVVAVISGDKAEAKLHMGRMQGFQDALCIMGVDFTKICYFNDRIKTAIHFAYRMKSRYSKQNN